MDLTYLTVGLAPFDIGGPSTVAEALIHQFIKTHLKVNLICVTSGSEKQISSLFNDKIESVKRLDPEKPISYYLRKMKDVWRAFGDCQLVHINDMYAIRGFCFPALAFLRGKPIVYSYHGWISNEISCYFQQERFRHLKRGIEKGFFEFEKNFWSAVVVNSKFSREIAIRDEGFDEKKIKVIPHGFDNEGMSKAPKAELKGDVKLLYIGMLNQNKRVDLILKAMGLLDPRIRERTKLYIVGKGPYEENYRSMVGLLKIGKYVEFLGALPLHECYGLYKSCDIFLSGSACESFGMSILEALGSGMPVIAVGSGAIPELIKNGRNGFLVNADPDEIADRITLLINQPDLHREISFNNKHDACEYSWPSIALSYLNLYRSLIRG